LLWLAVAVAAQTAVAVAVLVDTAQVLVVKTLEVEHLPKLL
jgi:hypothetical protein